MEFCLLLMKELNVLSSLDGRKHQNTDLFRSLVNSKHIHWSESCQETRICICQFVLQTSQAPAQTACNNHQDTSIYHVYGNMNKQIYFDWIRGIPLTFNYVLSGFTSSVTAVIYIVTNIAP